MRSLLIATALCAVVTLTGCSFTINGPCTSLSHQSRLRGECGCNADSGCDSCSPGNLLSSVGTQPECGTVDFGQGAPCGLESLSGKRIGGGLLSRLGNVGCNGPSPAPAMGDAGCGCEDSGCGCEDSSFVSTGNDGLGMGLFQRGTTCSDGSCGGGIRSLASGRVRGHLAGAGSRVAGAASHLGGHHLAGRGCGRFGCGRNGQLCLSCKAKLSTLIRGNGGTIPHTAQPMGPGGAGIAPSYAYPYYTTRGPRDFLMANPPSIGY